MYVIDAARRRALERFQVKLGVKFNDIGLLNTALTHASYTHDFEGMADYERMEFLGDAVLELAASTYLYGNFKKLSEGELTVTRANVVRGTTLAKRASSLGIGEMLLLSDSEESSGGRTRTSNLADSFEAIIAAIYLDSGWEAARDYIWRQLAPEFENVKAGNFTPNYKSELQELIQQRELTPENVIEYVELSESGPDHMKIFECAVKIGGKIYGRGVGKSKKIAEQIAAGEALKILNAGR